MLTLVPPSSFGGFVLAWGNGSESMITESPISSFRVHDRAAWSFLAAALLGAECALVEVDRGRRVVDGEIRREGAVTLRDRLRHAYLLWLGSRRRLARDSRHALESNQSDVLDSVSLIPQPRKRPSHLTRPRIIVLAVAVAAAALGWLLNYLFVADQSRAGLLSLPIWLLAGAAIGWLAIRWRERSRDQRLAESRLDAVGAASTDAILRVDADGVVAGWSAGAKALYGYEADEIIGRPLADLLGDDESDRVVEAIREGERLDEVTEQRSRGGDLFTAAITTIPSADPPEAIVVARDVGEAGRLSQRPPQRRGDRPLAHGAPAAGHLHPVVGTGRRRSSARRSTGSSATPPTSGSLIPASSSGSCTRRPGRVAR